MRINTEQNIGKFKSGRDTTAMMNSQLNTEGLIGGSQISVLARRGVGVRRPWAAWVVRGGEVLVGRALEAVAGKEHIIICC